MPNIANDKPICGALSVCLPALGLLVGFLSGAVGLAGPMTMLLSLCGPVGGIAFGAIGMARHEDSRWLPFLGLVLSVCVFACFFLA
jgi:hypothetical protein